MLEQRESPYPAPVGGSTLFSAAGVFFLLGSALSTVSALLFLHSLPRDERGSSTGWTVAFICAGLAAGLGLALFAVRDRLPARYATALPFIAVFLIALPMLWSRVMTPTGAILMIWPVLYSAFLLSETVTWSTTACCVLVLIGASFVDPHRTMVGYGPMATTLVLTGFVTVALQRRVRRLVAELGRQARTDPLTGLPNRRTLLETLQREAAEHRRRRSSLCVLMIDIDRFKALNDSAGHDAGDEALRRLARLMLSQTRRGDLIARFGGEEFTAMLTDCVLADAVTRADQLRARIESESREWAQPFTVSIGVAELAPDAAGTVSTVISNADNALYAAKRGGRNQVGVAEPEASA